MKIKAPFLTTRPGNPLRFYFQPRSEHRQNGWRTVRLHDQHGIPVTTIEAAIAAVAPCAEVYTRWRQGDANASAAWITEQGQVRNPRGPVARAATPDFKPGTVGAIIADYLAGPQFAALARTTQRVYRAQLRVVRELLGTTAWRLGTSSALRRRQIAGEFLDRIRVNSAEDARRYVSHMTRLMASVFNATRRLYEPGHPNHVPADENPFAGLEQGQPPESYRAPWPRPLVDAFVAFCDERGEHTIGDLVLFGARLGQRLTDLLALPAHKMALDRPLALHQRKTQAAVIIPWQSFPELVTRFAAMEKRRAEAVAAAGTPYPGRGNKPRMAPVTFVWRHRTGRPFTENRLGPDFIALRQDFARQHPTWRVDYTVGHFAHDEFLFDTHRMELAALRHTAVTHMAAAGIPAIQIAALTGHKLGTVHRIIEHYFRRTERGAANAITALLAWEATQARPKAAA